MNLEIARNLEEGPDYAADWRFQVVQSYLAQIAELRNPIAHLQEICWKEWDPFVRQFLRFRYSGHSVNEEAFRYAVGCQARNAVGGAASMIKAMIIADRTPQEIAQELGTSSLNIIAFAKLFFDVRRYLSNDVFLRRIVFSDVKEGMTSAEALRERRWLAVAFNRGWQGVKQVVFHRTAGTTEELEALAGKLQVTLASRALEFVSDLETSGTAPTEADLQRFLVMQNVQSRQPAKQQDDRKTMVQFLAAIHADIVENVDEHSDPKLKALKELKATTEEAGTPAIRLRRRFAGTC